MAAAPRRRRLDLLSIAVAPVGIGVILLAQRVDGGALDSLMQGPAALIVFGGTLGAVLVSFRPREIARAVREALGAFLVPDDNVDTLAATLTSFSVRAHRTGLLALESEIDALPDPFLRHGLALAVDDTPQATVLEFLTAEKAARDAHDEAPARVFEAAAGYAPTFGILGAVLGLIRVMEHLNAPAMLGSGMAVAFVSTAYGVGIANLVLLPIAGRLRERAAVAARHRGLVVQGVSAIHQRLHPRLVAQKIGVYTDSAAATPAAPLSARLPRSGTRQVARLAS